MEPSKATGRAISFSAAQDAGFFDSSSVVPEGEWIGVLLAKAWGRSVNQICFFENISTGQIHACTAFKTPAGYSAKSGNVDFSEPGIEGKTYFMETGKNRKGNPVWNHAREL